MTPSAPAVLAQPCSTVLVMPAAVTEGRTDGFTRLVLDRRGKLRGAVVVSPRAGETIAEATLAIAQGVSVATLTASTHPYPGFSDGLWNAAIGEYQRSLGRPSTRTAIRVLRGLRRRRPLLSRAPRG